MLMLNSAPGCLHRMDVDFVSNVSAANSASVFRMEACTVGEFPSIYICLEESG
jgi:hypothetical protein